MGKKPRTSIIWDGSLLDVTAPESVEILIREDHKVMWVNVNGHLALRCCLIGELSLVKDGVLQMMEKKEVPIGTV